MSNKKKWKRCLSLIRRRSRIVTGQYQFRLLFLFLILHLILLCNTNLDFILKHVLLLSVSLLSPSIISEVSLTSQIYTKLSYSTSNCLYFPPVSFISSPRSVGNPSLLVSVHLPSTYLPTTSFPFIPTLPFSNLRTQSLLNLY